MLTTEQVSLIKKYVPEKYFYVDRLINYLNLHDTVGIEVFEYVAKRVHKSPDPNFETILPVTFHPEGMDREDNYRPEPRDTFIRRIPFTFFVIDRGPSVDATGKEVEVWNPVEITNLLYTLGEEPFLPYCNRCGVPLTLEDAYSKLEFLFYEQGVSLQEIFEYLPKKAGLPHDSPYPDWFNYIDMCKTLGWTDYMPQQFYYKYNLAREALGQEPLLFPIETYVDTEDYKKEIDRYYIRNGNEIEMTGVFPVDDEGKPILRWIGVDIQNPALVTVNRMKSTDYALKIKLSPGTIIRALIPNDPDDIGMVNPEGGARWEQIYAGPQTMSFNYKVMKERRKLLKYTQQQVAEAVGANMRTYQKWENGETVPDGYYLLRILNWLNITDINDVIIYDGESDIKDISWS